MKLLTTICMPALILGVAALATPAMAQADAGASGNAAAATPAQPAQDANSATAPAGAAMNGQPSSSPGASASSSSSSNAQMALNTTGNASDLSSIPDSQRKYSRAKRTTDNRSESETTKQLNERESSLNGASSGNAQ